MAVREHWDNRFGFILAAIGSAIGLGNVWRFPYVCYKYGGGAFLIPYLIALFTAGIPIMILEFGIGHKMASGAPVALGKMKRNWEWLGWFALIVAFMITGYYAVIMGWCVNFIKYSFTLEWGSDPSAFFKSFLNLSEGHADIGYPQLHIIIAVLIAWVAIIGSIWKGAKSVGKVVYLTVLLPWLLLILFLIRGITLPGAFTGLAFYLKPNFHALLDLEVWSAAYTQVFFSLSVGFGVMMAYASFLPQKSDIVNNAFIISLADAGTAFIGGLVVFSTLGYYSHQTGLPVSDVVKAGPSLAFVTYPTIISMFPFLSKLFGVLFFLMLFTLGIDSAFSLVEAVITGVLDKYQRLKRTPTLISIGVIGTLIGIFYCTRAGLYWLDTVDHFMNQYGLMTVALLEVIFVGWFIKTQNLRDYINSNSEIRIGRWWDVLLKYILPIVLSVLLLSWLGNLIQASYEGYPRWSEFLGGWLLVFLIPLLAVIISGFYRAALLIGIIEASMICFSLIAARAGLDFASTFMFNVAFLILFGGIGICLYYAFRHQQEKAQI